MLRSVSLLLVFTLRLCAQPVQVVPGADRLLPEYRHLVKGKAIGLVTNHTGRLKDGRLLADVLARTKDLSLVALFAPEHGFRGSMDDSVRDTIDETTRVPVYSLYGKVRKPTPAMLRGIDLLLFDIQDVGARFYTYSSTLGYVLEAAGERRIPVIVLDRPNPIRGVVADGPVAEDTLRSFVAFGRLPIAHGMTVGELALLYTGERMLLGGVQPELTVVPAAGWKRTLWFDETDLAWIRPSPNMPSLSTATVYPGVCLVEGTNLSEGRGTATPFEIVGAPWADGRRVAGLLNAARITGVRFESAEFTPVSLQPNARPKHAGSLCRGVRIVVTDRNLFAPVKAGIWILWAFKTAHPDSFAWRKAVLDRLAGTAAIRTMLDAGKVPEEIIATWNGDLEKFTAVRRKYLLY